MDVISLANAGVTDVVATLGTATTPQHVQQLFQQALQVIFCFDGDNAGRKAAWRALESTLPALKDDIDARFLFLPQSEDPDSFVKKEGKQKFLELIDNAQSLADFFFMHFKEQTNTHTIEGRAHFVKMALPYIDNIAAPIFKEMMLDQLSAQARFEKSQLYQFLNQAKPVKTSHKIQRTPMRLAIALLLQNPELIRDVHISTDTLTLPGIELFKELVTVLQNNPDFTTGNLLEYFREKNESKLLHRLSAWQHGVPEEGIAAEFQDILHHLQKLQRSENIDSLMQKVHQNSLTETERTTLQNLLSGK
jgi:DNA primase